MDLFNQPTDFFSVLFPLLFIEILFVFLGFIQLDDIVLGDFNVDDLSLAQKWVHNSDIPLVLTCLDTVVLTELLLEFLL